MQIKSHNEETKLLYALKISHRDDSNLMKVDSFDDVWLFSFNSMGLTCVLGIGQLSMCLLNRIIALDVTYQKIMKLPYLLGS